MKSKPTETHTVMMPRELTAENGAKSIMPGEFFETITLSCPDCDGGRAHELNSACCSTCKDEGEIVQNIPVSWNNIKEIYKKAVKHFGN